MNKKYKNENTRLSDNIFQGIGFIPVSSFQVLRDSVLRYTDVPISGMPCTFAVNLI